LFDAVKMFFIRCHLRGHQNIVPQWLLGNTSRKSC